MHQVSPDHCIAARKLCTAAKVSSASFFFVGITEKSIALNLYGERFLIRLPTSARRIDGGKLDDSRSVFVALHRPLICRAIRAARLRGLARLGDSAGYRVSTLISFTTSEPDVALIFEIGFFSASAIVSIESCAQHIACAARLRGYRKSRNDHRAAP
jgi:hypothetical protein